MQKVTVVMTTYNLEKYVEQAVQSVLAQKTNFEYKLLIADDCSTDATLEILRKLQKEYPAKIEILTAEQNMGSLKNSNRAFAGVKSQYFAFLDGDDYWIGEQRLQAQVDFLEEHPDYAMCGGNTLLLKDDTTDKLLDETKTNRSYSFSDYLNGRTPFVHTSSIVLRNCIFINGLPDVYRKAEDTFENCAVRGEDFRFVTHLEQGKIMVFPETLSCYRIHSGGIWQGTSENKRRIENAIARNFFDKYWNRLDYSYFHDQCIATYRNLMRHLMEENIYNEYHLTQGETYLLTEYLKDIAHRKMTWTECDTRYVKEEKKSTLLQKIFKRLLG